MILSKILKNTFLVLIFGLVVTACATKKTTTILLTSFLASFLSSFLSFFLPSFLPSLLPSFLWSRLGAWVVGRVGWGAWGWLGRLLECSGGKPELRPWA